MDFNGLKRFIFGEGRDITVDTPRGYRTQWEQTYPSVTQRIGGGFNKLLESIKPDAPQPTTQPTVEPTIQPTVEPTVEPTPVGQIAGFKTWNPPANFSELVKSNSQKHGVNPALVAAHIQTESGFNPDAPDNVNYINGVADSRDRGLAQINDKWHPDVTDEMARNPEFAIEFIAKALADKYKEHGDWNLASASYNVGNRVGKNPSRDEMGLGPKGRAYLNKIVNNLDEKTLAELGLLPSYAE
jgi:soluble lytic murein transglycosylase-like protein